MRIAVEQQERSFHYALHLEAGDRREGPRCFDELGGPVRLVRDHWRVELPPVFEAVHGDRHAYALWLIAHPFVGERLELPFAVSAAFAAGMAQRYGARVGPVDDTLQARDVPAPGRRALLFSGGMDSTAASLVLPKDTPLLFHDRIPLHPRGRNTGVLASLYQQRRVSERLRADGHELHVLRDDHEQILDGYPRHHTAVTILPYLYLAESLGLSSYETGVVLGSLYAPGYDVGTGRPWRFTAEASLPPTMLRPEEELGRLLGLRAGFVCAGLSEVATALVVHRSAYRGLPYSCFQSSFHGHCLACDKCFRKLLLEHVFDGREVPAALFEHFLRVEGVRSLLTRPYLGHHHVFAYAFQRMRCTHPVAQELVRQFGEAPDLDFLTRFYPPALELLAPERRAEAEALIRARLEPMTPAEVARFADTEVPPLDPARLRPLLEEAM